MKILEVTIPGIAKPGGSKRAFAFKRADGSLGSRVTDDCKKNKDWRAVCALVAKQAMEGPPVTKPTPLALHVVFTMQRPRSHYGSGRNAGTLKPDAPKVHTVKPDATKLLRALEDAMTGIVWEDDSQIVNQSVRKIYGDEPGAWVWVGVHEHT